MNILLTSVGRRAYIVKYFKEAVGKDGLVHVCNSDELTVAFQYADKSTISPLIYDDSYIPFLLEYCKENSIDILISLFDIDLLVLAKHKKDFLKIGTQVIVSDPSFISVCNDKWETYCYLKSRGFHVPKTYISIDSVLSALKQGELQYPIIVKPRFGCGSIGMSVAEDEDELRYCLNKNCKEIGKTYLKYESNAVPIEEQVVFQECLCGQEYGADIINDLTGKYRNCILKRKIAMRAGETDIAVTIENNRMKEELERLGRITGHVANLDCDLFIVDGVPYILEMNSRFGGGYPFSHMAGCNLPKAIIAWVKNQDVAPEMLQAQSGIIGYKELIITHQRTIKR